MNPYAIVSSIMGTAEGASLRARLTAWHDAMVAHERRLRLGHAIDVCDEDCPHAEARTLWAEASAALGQRAGELTFLRSRAERASAQRSRGTRTASAPATSQSIAESPRPSSTVAAEL
jgi:hypothetical protein